MDRIPIEPGRTVLSKAGRDAGRRFVVLRVDETYAYIVDGDLRKMEAPKKKKHRHLRAQPAFHTGIADAIAEGRMPSNAEIRRCLSDTTEPKA